MENYLSEIVMEKNLTNKDRENEEKEAIIKRAIEAAYTVATPEEKDQLAQFAKRLHQS
ncbi:MAG TPA: DUF3813 family protein [Pseudogracilibacillus sp.]|nr:DUF3813 family protein [Pseudogracilibacillus sp.]